MTLTDILPFVQQLRIVDKLRLIRIIAEQLDAEGNIFPLEQGKIYDMPTPYNTFGVAEILMNKLEITNTNRDFEPVCLVFAWVKSDVPLILGQTNFFMEFDVCFYRSKSEFEIMPKSS